MSDKFEKTVFYAGFVGMFRFFLKTWNRMEVRGLENVPEEGGLLLASNHMSFLDPPAVAASCRVRPIRFMARDTLWNSKFGRWWMPRMGCIPVSRGTGDMRALKEIVKTLKAGSCASLFPEGTRSDDGELQKAESGVGFIALKAGVPVVPIYVEGTFDAWPRHAKFIHPKKITVTYGKPIQPEELAALGSGREAYDLAAKLIMNRITALKD